jgi:hypothetical protein
MRFRPKAGVLKKVSYIKLRQTDLGAKSSDPKALLYNNLPPEALVRYIRPQASNPKCNAKFAQARLSPTKSPDSSFTFFVFLSPAFNSLHCCDQPSRLENETGVPSQSRFNPNWINKMYSHFSPELSQNVLFVSRPCCRPSFFQKREAPKVRPAPAFDGCLISGGS